MNISMGKLYQNPSPGVFPILDKMNDNKEKWFLHKDGKIIFEVSFIPGSGATMLYFYENENDKTNDNESRAIIKIQNEWLVEVEDYYEFEKSYIENVGNPNPTIQLKAFLRKYKLERILNH